MKTRQLSRLATSTLTIVLSFTSAGVAETTRTRMGEQPSVVAASESTAGKSARSLIGQDVLDRNGKPLGELNDLVIDAKTGRAVLATVGSGGVLGVGEKVRAVPVSLLSQRAGNELQVDAERTKWDAATQYSRDDLGGLSFARAEDVYRHFGENLPLGKESGGAAAGGALVLATKLKGTELVNAGQRIGEVDDVIVNLSNGRTSLLVDPDAGYVGTSETFVISMNKVGEIRADHKRLETRLTRDDFERATPAESNWADVSDSFVYRWTAVPPFSPVAPAPTDGEIRRASARTDQPIAMIKEALRSDAALGRAAENVEITREGNELILRGTVPTRQIKDKIEERTEELAPGMDVNNELRLATGE